MSTINKYAELKKKLDKLEKTVRQPPFENELFIDRDGNFGSNTELWLAPEEAFRLGEFLVDFFGPEEEKK